jgi:hypothetical protein
MHGFCSPPAGRWAAAIVLRIAGSLPRAGFVRPVRVKQQPGARASSFEASFMQRFSLGFQRQLPKHWNLAAPNTTPVNSLFGKINATTGYPRYIHFGLKLIY